MIEFPYYNSQQLNLDWLMHHISNTVVKVPAIAFTGSDVSAVETVIDNAGDSIPVGFSVVMLGADGDSMERCACVLLYKIDNDNMRGIVMSMSAEIGVQNILKTGGVWND